MNALGYAVVVAMIVWTVGGLLLKLGGAMI